MAEADRETGGCRWRFRVLGWGENEGQVITGAAARFPQCQWIKPWQRPAENFRYKKLLQSVK